MAPERNILLVTDEQSLAVALQQVLEPCGWFIRWHAGYPRLLTEGSVAAIVADLRSPSLDHARLAGFANEALSLHIPFIAITAEDTPRLPEATARALTTTWRYPVAWPDVPHRLRAELEETQRPTPSCRAAAPFVKGSSQAFQTVLEQVRMVAAFDTRVLITGETGVGKERIAQAIHAESIRRHRPFVAVNCAGIPPTLLEDEFFGHVRGAFTDARERRAGRFEQADNGTLFLDEIAELPLELQAKLLRVLQENVICPVGSSTPIKVDARIIAATNVDLGEEVREKRFREDIFYRINVFVIRVPPLRERREDIPHLIDQYIDYFCSRCGIPRKSVDSATVFELAQRPWYGNVRELENAIEVGIVKAGRRSHLAVDDFPPPSDCRGHRVLPSGSPLGAETDFHSLVAHFERMLIGLAMDRHGGNKSQAAQSLGLKRSTMSEKLKRLNEAIGTGGDS